MNINLRKCKKCGKVYDIGTNFDICPECRREEDRWEDERII